MTHFACRGILWTKMLFSMSMFLPLIAPATRISRESDPLTFPFIWKAVAQLAHASPRSMWIEIIYIYYHGNSYFGDSGKWYQETDWMRPMTCPNVSLGNTIHEQWGVNQKTVIAWWLHEISEECRLINISNLAMWPSVTELNNSTSCRNN